MKGPRSFTRLCRVLARQTWCLCWRRHRLRSNAQSCEQSVTHKIHENKLGSANGMLCVEVIAWKCWRLKRENVYIGAGTSSLNREKPQGFLPLPRGETQFFCRNRNQISFDFISLMIIVSRGRKRASISTNMQLIPADSAMQCEAFL